jgi:putative endopeptidase
MVTQIRAVLTERLKTVPWLTEPTRREALSKAKIFGVKIAYPDKWHDYSALRITPGSFVTQRAEAFQFESDRLMARIGHAQDPAEWDFHGQYHFVPQSPTAWANWDEIIFPAAYLQAPLYDSTADLATNYAGIGVVIAHEMTHLFTADGGDIDGAGLIRHWWTPTDSIRFAAIQNRLIQQYDRYTVLDSATHVNGTLTIGENLADVGGVELAYAALERAVAQSSKKAQSDTTPEKRFFLAYAHARVSKSRPEYLRQALANDGHAPSMFRVNGPLADFVPFGKIFGCKVGDPMMPADSMRTQIWQ